MRVANFRCKFKYFATPTGRSRDPLFADPWRNLYWMNATVRGLQYWNFNLLSFWLAISLLCDVSFAFATMNKKFSRALLRNVRDRVMITPANPLRTRLIHISPSYWTIYRSFETILECPLDGNFNPMFYTNTLLQKKNIQSDMNYIWKNTSSQRAARALTNEPE